MTAREWIASRTPAPPPALLSRIGIALGAHAGTHCSVHEECIDAAVDALEQLLDAGPLGRDKAADLLAIDALVTYAIEASADDPLLEQQTDESMVRLAALADSGEPAAN